MTHLVAHYSVKNTAPRPESYLTNYNTANGLGTKLNESQGTDFASGAETGWDYTTTYLLKQHPLYVVILQLLLTDVVF